MVKLGAYKITRAAAASSFFRTVGRKSLALYTFCCLPLSERRGGNSNGFISLEGPSWKGYAQLSSLSPPAVVVLAFVVCWLPLHVGRILFAQGSPVLYEVSQYFNLVSMLLFYLGASVNPILYNIMSQKYRRAMCKFLNHSRVWQSRHLRQVNHLFTQKQDSKAPQEVPFFYSAVAHQCAASSSVDRKDKIKS